MLALVIVTQLLLASPYRSRLADDELNGRALKIVESLIDSGSVTLDKLGEYEPYSAVVLINGAPQKTVDAFPAEFSVSSDDILEVQLEPGSPEFYVFLSAKKGRITADMEESTIPVGPGINYICKVRSSDSP